MPNLGTSNATGDAFDRIGSLVTGLQAALTSIFYPERALTREESAFLTLPQPFGRSMIQTHPLTQVTA
jgi:hypothetical protein